MKTANERISREFSRGNFEAAFPYFAEGVQWNIIGSTAIRGKEAVIAWCNKMKTEMDNSTLNNTNYITGDRFIAVQGYCDYVKENNDPCKVEYCDVYRFIDESLQEITSYCVEIKHEGNSFPQA